jgi:hypothetical protein
VVDCHHQKTAGFAAAECHLCAVAGPATFFAYLLPDPEHSVAARSLLAVGYVLAALSWLVASKRAGPASAGFFARWWFAGAVLLFLLAINKQFDLRAHFERGFRAFAKAGNWYDQRQPVQFVVALVLPFVCAVFVGILLATKARLFVRFHPLALIGWLLLLLYLGLRQTQEWKPMLPWLESMRYHDWRLALEFAGILLVSLAALAAPLRLPPARSRAASRAN